MGANDGGTINGTNYFTDNTGGNNGIAEGSCASTATCERKTAAQLQALASISGWSTGGTGNWNLGTTSELPRLQYGDKCGSNTGVDCGAVIEGQFTENRPPVIVTESLRLPLMPDVLPDHLDTSLSAQITSRQYHYLRDVMKVEYWDKEDDQVKFTLVSQTSNNPDAFCNVTYYANPSSRRNVPEVNHCVDLSFGITPLGYVYIKDPLLLGVEEYRSEGDYFPAYNFKEEQLQISLREVAH